MSKVSSLINLCLWTLKTQKIEKGRWHIKPTEKIIDSYKNCIPTELLCKIIGVDLCDFCKQPSIDDGILRVDFIDKPKESVKHTSMICQDCARNYRRLKVFIRDAEIWFEKVRGNCK